MENNDEKIVHARNLLKKFQKQQQNNNFMGQSTTATTFPPINSNNSMQLDSSCNESLCNEGTSQMSKSRESSRPPSSVGQGNELLANNLVNHEQFRCHSVPKNFSSENIELNSLRNASIQKQKELDDALFKLQSLQKHYAGLYKAYNQLANQNGEANTQSKYVEQIHQLRTTLAVTMDEKTALQSELRDLKAKMDGIIVDENHQNNNAIATNFELEIQFKKLINERDQLFETIKGQSEQIEQQRRECSNLEAKFVLIQQDRLDSQARLKSLFEEKSQLETNIEQMRQDLGMRDIYLRQLAKHTGNEQYFPGQNMIHENALENSERKKVEGELEELKQRLGDMQKQMEATKENYAFSINQANGQIEKLEAELNYLRTIKGELESTNGYLEEQLKIAQNNIQILSSTKNQMNQPSVDPEEFLNLQKQIAWMADDKEKANGKLEEISQLLKSKGQELDTIKLALVEGEAKIFQLEQAQNLNSTINSDAAVLSTQLQNEKATVSRAIAQNIELKSQLSELQDKLVQVINESAAKEDERMTALATIEMLKKENNEIGTSELAMNSLSMVKAPIVTIAPFENENNKNTHLNEDEMDERCSNPSKMCTKEIETETQNDEINKNQLKMSGQLDQRLEELFKEKEQFKMDNQKLQYWLTALETENESIGEYIALYRFQRGNIQKKMTEKDQQLQKLRLENSALISKLTELHNSVIEYLHNREVNKNTSIEAPNQNDEISSNINTDKNEENQNKSDNQNGENLLVSNECSNELGRLIQALERSKFIENQATCSTTQNSQIQCTGCLECRGEMYTL